MGIALAKSKTPYFKHHLKKQGYEGINDVLVSKDELYPGSEYLIADVGLGEFNGGYRYKGIINGMYYFEDTLSPFNDNPIEFTEEEIIDAINNKEIAIPESLKINKNIMKKLVCESLEEVIYFENEINEAKKKKKKWIQKVDKAIEKRGTEGVCTGKKFGGPTCPKGSKRYNLAKTFKAMAKKKKK